MPQILFHLIRLSTLLCACWAAAGAFASGRLPAASLPALAPAAIANADPLTAELHRILLSAGIRPALREDLQRPIDPRLVRLETLGIEGSGLFSGRKYHARNAREVQELSTKLKPGDQLVLTGNDWNDAHLVFGGAGTAEAPIFFGAEGPAPVVLSGSSSLFLHGRNLVVMNLAFRDGILSDTAKTVIQLGDNGARPAESCILDRISIENVNSKTPRQWKETLINYVQVSGHDHTIAHSTFAHLKNYGVVISSGDAPSDTPQRLHLLNNRFIDRPRLDEDPSPFRYKIIQIGWSGLKAAPAGSLIQDNYFEDCSSHVELISIKVSDVFVRRNSFIRCRGAVNLRMGDRALIQNNLFDGEGAPATGGLRVAGRDHVIVGNTFRRLHPEEFSQMWPVPKPPTRYLAWVFSIATGDSEASGFTGTAYGRASTLLISHNSFEHNTGRIALGSPTPSTASVEFLPRNVRIEYNTFTDDGKPQELFDFIAPDPSNTLPGEIFLYDNRFVP